MQTNSARLPARRSGVTVAPDAREAARLVATRIVAFMKEKPDAVLGLATGATMEPVYAELVAAYRAGNVSFASASTFNLDEYVGLASEHPAAYRSTMNRLLFDHVDIDKTRTHVPDGHASDPSAAAARYEAAIAATGPIDLQLLGIGRNGHIGFNEPGSPLDSRTRVVELHSSTLDANRAFFPDGRMPHFAITMGIATILQARRILLLATGPAKRDAVVRAHAGGFDIDCPASALSDHANVEWIVDAEAAAGLSG